MSLSSNTPRKPTDDPLLAVIGPALKVGALSGGAGFLVGGTAGILKNISPGIFALASGIQCSVLGTSFWASRSLVLEAWDTGNLTPSDRTKASAIAGGFSGGASGLIFRGRRSVIPGALCMAFFGYAGQSIYNRWTATPAPAKTDEKPKGFWQSMANLGVMSHLTDEEYTEILKQRLLKINVEIAVLDDKIAALKNAQTSESSEEESPEK